MRVGIIGLGVGEQHIQGYREAGCEIAGLCDFDLEKLENIGARNPGAFLTDNAQAIISNQTIDVVSIASYDHSHAEQVTQALRAGKHVFVEKPLCRNRSELAEIGAGLFVHPELKLSCNLPLRYAPRFQQARELDLGRIYYIDAAYDYGRAWKLKGWRGQRDDYSVVCGGLVHMVDLVLWITGEQVVDVTARGSKVGGFPFNDLVVAILEMESGALIRLTANFTCRHPHFHELQLFGTEGTFVNRLNGSAEVYYENEEPPPHGNICDSTEAPKHAAIPDFVEAIRNDTEPPISPKEIFDAMEVCFAIEEAAERFPLDVPRWTCRNDSVR